MVFLSLRPLVSEKSFQSKPPFSQLSYTQSSAEADIFLPLIWFQTSILYHSSCNTSPDKSEQFSPGVEMREEFRSCFVFFTVSGDTYLIYPEYRMQVGTVHPKLKSHNFHNTMSFQNSYKCFLFFFILFFLWNTIAQFLDNLFPYKDIS